jgi:redox-sensing transcriptional repressor
MKAEKISELTTNRLSVYLRCLNELAENNEETISSEALAKRFHLNSAQIRKDLAYFGEFGVRGVGYDVAELREHLTKILGLDKQHRVCIVGSGRLGMALADYYGFRQKNFFVTALFDSDKRKIGKKIRGVEVFDIKDFSPVVKKAKIEVAVIAVPAGSAQRVLDMVVSSGIRAVMNFAPVPLKAADEVKLNTVDLTSSLESLAYFLAGNSNSTGRNSKPRSGGRRN